ncbi:LOW QUALITY PROTEIN: F-box only protein 36 [Chlamydotis macqueenii]
MVLDIHLFFPFFFFLFFFFFHYCRWWKISFKNEFCESRPGEIKESHKGFLDDSLHTSTFSYNEIRNSNALWENIVENSCDTITPEMKELAQAMGWKQFFTNRLQLQLQLRRRRQKHDVQNKQLTE